MRKRFHVGIILDGNRRFAKRLMLEPRKGHEYGAKKVGNLLEWCKEFGIRELTLYCFSLENFNRPKQEFNYLMNLFKEEFRRLRKDTRLEENHIKLRFIGKRELFDKEIQDAIQKLEYRTKQNKKYVINFAFGYGGRQEILEAVKELAKAKEPVNEQNLRKHLWLQSEPDLIIRTGGEKRTSNFLPWQSVYSEWVFVDKMWPEFTKADLRKAISEFRKRERRFGR